MRKNLRWFPVVATAVLCVYVVAQPQNSADVPTFDPNHQVTIHGTIQQINDYDCPVRKTVGTHLQVKTGDGIIEVHVAAAKFLQQFGIKFNVGDSVEMTGSKGTYQGRPAFLPRIIVVGNDKYYLRDEKGRPVW